MTSPLTSEELEHLWDETPEAPSPIHRANGESVTTADPDVDEFLAGDDPEYDWLIPGLLERGDRVILTGGEGTGKTTLLRQLGTQAAAGLHPFDDVEVEPVRVLLVDLENSRRATRRKLRPLRLAAGPRLDPGHLRVIVRPEGIDLLGDPDRRWLAERVDANSPEILVIGPLYKMSEGDPTEERVARTVARCLDDLREHHGVALLIEAHQRHAAPRESRPERPYGASLWVRWPEFGLCLAPDGRLLHWRGPRDERAWPAALRRGGAWPWTVSDELEKELPRSDIDKQRLLAAVERTPWAKTREELISEVGGRAARVRQAFDELVRDGQLVPFLASRDRRDHKPHEVKLWGVTVRDGGSGTEALQEETELWGNPCSAMV